jgi:hypothetical protein
MKSGNTELLYVKAGGTYWSMRLIPLRQGKLYYTVSHVLI